MTFISSAPRASALRKLFVCSKADWGKRYALTLLGR